MTKDEFKAHRAKAIADVLLTIAELHTKLSNPECTDSQKFDFMISIRIHYSQIELILQTPFPKFEKGGQ